MAEFEQLRVGVFQQLDDGFCAGGAVIEKCTVPADYRQIVRIVRNLRLQYFLALAIRQCAVLTAHDLRNASPFSGEQFGRGGVSGDLAHVEDEIVFVQPLVVVLDLAIETLTAFEYQRLNPFDDRRTLVTDISRSSMLEAGLLAAGAEDVTEIVESNLFAHVELDQDQNRALQGFVLALDGLTVRCRGKNRSAFGFHG